MNIQAIRLCQAPAAITRRRLLGESELNEGDSDTNAEGRKSVNETPTDCKGVDSLTKTLDSVIRVPLASNIHHSCYCVSDLMDTLSCPKSNKKNWRMPEGYSYARNLERG